MYAFLFRYSDAASFLLVRRDVKTTNLAGNDVKETKRAGYLIYKDPISKYEKFITFYSGKQRSDSRYCEGKCCSFSQRKMARALGYSKKVHNFKCRIYSD